MDPRCNSDDFEYYSDLTSDYFSFCAKCESFTFNLFDYTHYGFIDKGCLVKEISAAELEASCRKCVRVKVSDTKILASVLDKLGIEYNVTSDNTADIYGNIKLSKLAAALADNNCDLISSHEIDESLETYFINLVGGGKQ